MLNLFIMKKTIAYASLLFSLLSFFVLSCQEETQLKEQQRGDAGLKTEGQAHGHLTQTKTYSSDVVQRWLAVQTQMLYDPASKVAGGIPLYGLNANRWMAYCGVALYEAVVPGMPSYQSLSGQLNEMPGMPEAEPGKSYHWPSCANAALAEMSRKLFGNHYDAATGDALEQELSLVYQEEIGDPVIFNRSVAFGKTVAEKIVAWAGTDRPWLTKPALQLSYVVGQWWPANLPADQVALVPAGIAYWGETRTMVPGSIDNVASTSPLQEYLYSEDPNSAYYKDMQEVYEVSKVLTLNQRLQAQYYDDPASKGYPAGASYFSILKQVVEQIDPGLDVAAIAYAKAGMALMDASIGSFKTKFLYKTERPFQFIQRVIGLADAQASTWESYIPTPGHPDFPANHAVFSSSVAYALTSVFGDNVHFTNSAYAGKMVDLKDGFGVQDLGTRSYTSFYDMMNDIAFSRLYGGIHTRYACVDGIKQGIKTGTNIHDRVKFQKD
jgi:hypothetical protein